MNEFFEIDHSKAFCLIRSIRAECPELIKFIRESAPRYPRWQHHLPAMERAIERLRIRCEHELSHLGEWREDYLQPDEIAGNVSRAFTELTRWLSRMTR